MKVFVAVLFLCTISFTLIAAQGDEQFYYSRRYDSIDVNTIFRSSRLLNNYVDCLLDKKPCPPEGKDLKSKKKLMANLCQMSEVLKASEVNEVFDSCALCENRF